MAIDLVTTPSAFLADLRSYVEQLEQGHKGDPVSRLLRRAEAGDTECMYLAAIALFSGTGVERNVEQAVHLCKGAADQGSTGAKHFLSGMYEVGVAPYLAASEECALKLLAEAAEQGRAAAQSSLAVLYLAGRYVDKDINTALALLRQAASNGDRYAQDMLGMQLLRVGVAPKEEAIALIRRSADDGYAPAHRHLGGFYRFGEHGFPRDERLAEWHFARAQEIDEADGVVT